MFAFINSHEKSSPTIIGAGCRFNGDIKTEHSIQIHGIVIGNVYADTVVVGLGGKVIGKIITNVLFLHGTIEGPVTTDTANVFNNAQMTGTLSYYTLNITGNNGLECKLLKRKDKK